MVLREAECSGEVLYEQARAILEDGERLNAMGPCGGVYGSAGFRTADHGHYDGADQKVNAKEAALWIEK